MGAGSSMLTNINEEVVLSKILPGLRSAAPAIVMVAGTVPMIACDTPVTVKCGGACLAGVALMLADMQSKKRLGYSDTVVRAVRTVPGMSGAEEGDVLGLLTLSASVFLGVPESLQIVASGQVWPGALNQAYNYLSFPAGAALGMRGSQQAIEGYVGKEFSFPYTDEQGQAQKTEPVSTARLLQGIAYLSGAAGVAAYGAALGAADIQFTGVMFGLSNGISIARLMREPVGQVMQGKMENLAREIEAELGRQGSEPAQTALEHMKQLREKWKTLSEEYGQGKPAKTMDVKEMGYRAGAVLLRSVAQWWKPMGADEKRAR